MIDLHSSRIIVAGGSLSGQSAVTELIDRGFAGEIVWITGEAGGVYSKPALSKEFMQGRVSLESILLPAIDPCGANLKIIDGSRCLSLDAQARHLQLDDGRYFDFDGLLICTGASARMPDFARNIDNVLPLRTLEHALAIQQAVRTKPRVLILGGGLIGCEMAASLRGLDLDVTLIEMQARLLERPFGGAFGDYFEQLHRRNGVTVLTGQSLARLQTANGKVTGAELADGRLLPADLVLVGAGSIPETAWLAGSGLALENGVLCDDTLCSSVPGIFAAGDIASWVNPLYGVRMRVEHWTNASAQGRAAATNLLAALSGDAPGMKSFGDIPYFWSDQYGLKIQMVGWHPGHDRAVVEQPEGAPGPVIKYFQGDRLVAAAGVNASRAVMTFRRQIEAEARRTVLEPAHA